MTEAPTTAPPSARLLRALPAQRRRRQLVSRVLSGAMKTACVLSAAVIIAILFAVLAYLVTLGGSALSWQLFTDVPRARGMEGYPGGMANAIVGTGILLALAGTIGIPVGVLTGVFLSEYGSRSRLTMPVRFICDVLAGVPSIVVGILGYELLVVPVGHYNGYAGAVALAIVMVPIVARVTEEMLLLVPTSYREGSLALGATLAQTIFRVVLPAGKGGLVTGVMLAMARVAGETAPLLFTALGSRLMTLDPSQPLPSLTVQIFNYATGPYPAEQKLAWAAMLVLIFLVFLFNILVRLAVRGRHPVGR
ncbi:MAG TPA: phosphate ABC transporter permease PstA [Planctomycetota bacterium]|nr:phosphate ABC transporter permease PstA [Planctomycetota bacterium]